MTLSRLEKWLLDIATYTWSFRNVSDLWPGKRNCLTWSFGHLITLKVVPLGLHTLHPAVPPLMEACRKTSFGMEFSSAFVAAIMSSLVWNRVPFNGLLSLWNSQKSQGPYQEFKEPVETQESVFLPKSLNQLRGMCWSIIVMEAPISWWPQVLSLSPHSIT